MNCSRPKNNNKCRGKSSEVRKRAVFLAQSTISLTLMEQQAKSKKSEMVKARREMPQGVGLAIHQTFRSKEIIKMLYGFGFSVEKKRLLRVEADIVQSVIRRMKQNDVVYLPPDILLGRHVFFAVDNVDFSEDTHDGRKTFEFRGAAMAIYQKTPNWKSGCRLNTLLKVSIFCCCRKKKKFWF